MMIRLQQHCCSIRRPRDMMGEEGWKRFSRCHESRQVLLHMFRTEVCQLRVLRVIVLHRSGQCLEVVHDRDQRGRHMRANRRREDGLVDSVDTDTAGVVGGLLLLLLWSSSSVMVSE